MKKRNVQDTKKKIDTCLVSLENLLSSTTLARSTDSSTDSRRVVVSAGETYL
jgi:hypothetical protein